MPSEREILHIVPAEPLGGIQALVPVLAREQVRQGKTVRLVCLGRGTRIRAVAADNGLAGVSCSLYGLLAPVRLFGTVLGARRAIVHSHCEPVWASAILAVAAYGRWIEHAHVYPDDASTWKKRISRWLQRHFATRHIAVSHSIGRALIASGVAPPAALDVVYNGMPITADNRSRSARLDFTLGFVGRIVEEKGIFDFVELAALLSDEAHLAFAVYGDGADLTAAQALAARHGIADRIVFHGYVADIAAAWRDIDVAAIFSHREPFGLVFLEAALRGVSTISYDDDSGGSEVAAALDSAHRVAPGDLSAAAALVRAFAATPSAAGRASERDRKVIGKRFGIDTMAYGVDAAYRRLDRSAIAPPAMPVRFPS